MQLRHFVATTGYCYPTGKIIIRVHDVFMWVVIGLLKVKDIGQLTWTW